MKASRSAAKKTKSSAAAPVKKPRRKRQSGVRGRILKILAAGPITGPELLKRGKFSPAALYLNLKAMRAEGLVESQRHGRSVTIGLAQGAAAAAESAPIEGEVVAEQPRAKSGGSALVPAMIPQDLHEALNAVAFRLSPVARVQEKLVVLDQLARSMPAPVAEVLRSVIDDVAKLTTLKSGE